MNIGLGRVTDYFFEKGFGFVSNDLNLGSDDGVFFHVNKLKKFDPKFVASIESHCYPNCFGKKKLNAYLEGDKYVSTALSILYEIEETKKGNQVNLVLDKRDLATRYGDELQSLSREIERIWMFLGDRIPEYFQLHSEELLGMHRVHELKEKRREKINEAESIIEELSLLDLPEFENRMKNDEVEGLIRSVCRRGFDVQSLRSDVTQNYVKKVLKRIIKLTKQADILEREYNSLVAELSSLGFAHDNELSFHIRNNKIDRKFDGGIPHDVYRKICHDLGITIEGNREEHLNEFGCFRKGDFVEVIAGHRIGHRGKLGSYWRDTWEINCSPSSAYLIFDYPENLRLQTGNEKDFGI